MMRGREVWSPYLRQSLNVFCGLLEQSPVKIQNNPIRVTRLMHMCDMTNVYVWHAAQEWTNRTLAVHELTSVHFLELPGSLLSITKITEYRYFSPLKPIRELRY